MQYKKQNVLAIFSAVVILSFQSSCSNVLTPTDYVLSRVQVNTQSGDFSRDITSNFSNVIADSKSAVSKISSESIRSSFSNLNSSSSSSVSSNSINEDVMKLKIEKSDSSKLIYESSNLNLETKSIGLVRLNVTNTSMANSIKVFFTTYDDLKYSSNKSVIVNIMTDTPGPKSYLADLTLCYGYTGRIKTLKIESSVIFDGDLTLHSLELLNGGVNKQPFTIGAKHVAAYRKDIISTSDGTQCFFPDGLMGVMKQKDGSLKFFGSSPVLSGLKSVISFKGSYEKPVGSLVFKDGEIQNVPTGQGESLYKYASIGQIWNFQGEECLTVIHVETHYDAQGGYSSNQYYTSALALGYSPDMGNTWKFAGVFGRQMCEGETNNQKYGMGGQMPPNLNGGNPVSRDVGNGTFIIKDGYIYVYMSDLDKNYSPGFAVLRAKTSEVIQAVRNGSSGNLTIFSKLYDGEFSQPGYKGKSTSVTDGFCPPNFASILYSSYLKKYVFIRCSSPYFSSNDGDIVMNISDNPLSFKGNNYYIDAGTNGQQYPTAVGIGDNPGFVTGKSLNLYYIDYTVDSTFLWFKAKIIRREIIFD